MSVYPAPTVHRFSRIRRRANAGRVRPVRHTEDETYEFDMAFKKAKPMEAYEPGECPGHAPGDPRALRRPKR
jgi:hypothetical protein